MAAVILILGVTWFTVGALSKAASSSADREIKTGLALRAAKNALLAHVAQYAARSNIADPGQLPCPESVNLTSVGEAPGNCGNAMAIGRLPWKTLGIDQLRDGDGEPLWYVISPGFRDPPINFGTVGQLSYNGVPNAAVALIIAPGRPLTVGGCNTMNQQVVTRNTAALVAGNFLECGNITGNYANPGSSQWNNDRVIAITAAEWMDAIAGPVADRLQRTVAPALNAWRTTHSVADWQVSYLPYASTISVIDDTTAPATNDMCGNTNSREGMPPTITVSTAVATGTCSTSWISGTVTQGPGPGTLNSGSCSQTGTELACTFDYIDGPLSARITATAPLIARTFRAATKLSDIAATDQLGTSVLVQNLSISISPSAPNNATLSFDVALPLTAVPNLVTVRIPNLADATMFSDPAVAWFRTNGWDRHTYYAIASAVTVNPGANVCTTANRSDCLKVNGLPASNGNNDDKRIVLVLMGRGIVGQSRICVGDLNVNGVSDCVDRAQHLEGHNASNGDDVFTSTRITTTTIIATSSNDRLATCPFQQTPASGTPVPICD